MFEIRIWITTPDEEHGFTEWNCSDTECLTEKGKRNCCRHCPIFINENNRATEIGILKSRIDNIFYQAQVYPLNVQKKISEIFKENPIEKLR